MTQSAAATPVIVDRGTSFVIARVHRPDRANSINGAVVSALEALLDELEAEPKVLILTGGTDGIFVGGSDIGDLSNRRFHEGLVGPVVRLFDRIASLPLPTIAAVDGPALGGGAELAYACDIRVGTPRTRFAQPEPRLGIIAGAGAIWRLPRLVGDSIARQVLLAGRELDAPAALDCGLLLCVVDPEELIGVASEVAARITQLSVEALRLTKLCLNADPGAHPHVDLVSQALLFESANTQSRLGDYLAGRAVRRAAQGEQHGET